MVEEPRTMDGLVGAVVTPVLPPGDNRSSSLCNSTCGCYERELCPQLYDASADSPAVWTCVELLFVAALCWMQGLRPLDIPGRFFQRLRVALTGRTGLDEAAAELLGGPAVGATGPTWANAPRLLAAFAAGSAGLLGIGLRSGFLCRAPDAATITSAEALMMLPVW